MPNKPNHLIHEKSPYLLQHAHNPVDWHPWGPEALEKARREDKPIFLSIGYSTCHWCHVMEKESFEDPKVAAVLNRIFVCIKLDREERPDLDSIYMTAVQGMTGRGGWPLSVFLSPDLKPFYGGTYFPPVDTPGRGIGLTTLVTRLEELWKDKRADLLKQSEEIGRFLKESLAERATEESGPLQAGLLQSALAQVARNYDEENGGFSPAPKFPRPMLCSFLWRMSQGDPSTMAAKMSARTLEAMDRGGIHDHLGGGFARYSTDEQWLVPHFEKMLYDNALLALAYVEGWQVTGNPEFKDVVEDILAYVQRDLRHKEGGFFSAEDADSEGKEGLFYVWKPKQIEEILGKEDGRRFNELFGVSEEGNFEEGLSILHLPGDRWLPAEEEKVRQWKARLLEVRSRRIRPSLDDKVLTGWNGLMISAFARAGQALDRPDYVASAAAAAAFLLKNCRGPQGLWRRWREGEARFAATCEDYAFLVGGLLDLAECGTDPRWLKAALELNAEMLKKFKDEAGGALFYSQAGDPDLLTRPKDGDDNAIPSANSAAIANLLRLAEITGQDKLEDEARALLQHFSGKMGQIPMAFPQMLCSLDLYLAKKKEVVIVGSQQDEASQALAKKVHQAFLPNKVFLWSEPKGLQREEMEKLSPLLEGKTPAAYVCERRACKKPTQDAEELAAQLA